MSRVSDPWAPGAAFVLVLAPGANHDLGAQVHAGLAVVPDDEVLIDLRRVAAVDPPLLRALRAVAAETRGVTLTGATPEVYKALHVAGVAPLFRRV